MSACRFGLIACLATGVLLGAGASARAEGLFSAVRSGDTEDWYVTIGVIGQAVPSYPGADDYSFRPGGIFSIAKASQRNVFRSIDDNPSIALIDNGVFRLGAVGRLDWGRDEDASDRLTGLGDIDMAVEAGGFAEWYPFEWLRVRGELRYGMGGFEGIRGGLEADAIATYGSWRFAVGPRLSYAGSGYMSTYFGVTPLQSMSATLLGNPMPAYQASAGFDQVGALAQLSYTFDNGIAAGVFGSYGYLLGDAADSPLTSDDSQFTAGVTLSYTFNMGKAWW